MPPEYRAVFEQWSPPLFLTAATLVSAIVYTRGWFAIRKTRSHLFPTWRLAAYLLGLGTIWLSIASPLDGFADALLSAHMVKHPPDILRPSTATPRIPNRSTPPRSSPGTPPRSFHPLKVPSQPRSFSYNASSCLARNEPHLPRMAHPTGLL